MKLRNVTGDDIPYFSMLLVHRREMPGRAIPPSTVIGLAAAPSPSASALPWEAADPRLSPRVAGGGGELSANHRAYRGVCSPPGPIIGICAAGILIRAVAPHPQRQAPNRR